MADRRRSSTVALAAGAALAVLLGSAPASAAGTSAEVTPLAEVQPEHAVTAHPAPATAARGVIVEFSLHAGAAARRDVAAREQLAERGVLPLGAGQVFAGAEGRDWEAVAARLRQDPSVTSASPDYLRAAAYIPPDEYFPLLWGLHNTGQTVGGKAGVVDVDVDAPRAWDVQRGSAGVTVAVIDTGVQTSHPDLQSAIWTNPGEIAGNGKDDDGNGYVDDVNGWDFYNGDASVYDAADGDEHGTHVAGTVAARSDPGGVVGTAFGVRVMPLKVLGPKGGYDSDVIRALGYASAQGVRIINTSLAGPGFSTALRNAISASGALVVAAAGNSGSSQDLYAESEYPGGFDLANVVQVAAVDHRGSLAGFSNTGRSVELAAPGVNIASTVPGGYAYMSGTSMAAPHVAGVAALLLSRDPSLSGMDLAPRVVSTTKNLTSLPSAATCTRGMVDADAALLSFQPLVRLSGLDRWETAAVISRQTCRAGVARVYVANGRDFPDALAGAPAAARDDSSVVLVDQNAVPTAAAAELLRIKPQEIVVLGGTGVVSSAVASSLATYAVTGVVRRLSGTNRYSTAAAVSKSTFTRASTVYLATGASFPDALAGAALAGQQGAPVLLTARDTLPTPTLDELLRLKPAEVVVLGGTGVISAAVAAQVAEALPAAVVKRVGGKDRYETAAMLAKAHAPGVPVAYVVTGADFPDAVAGAALAAQTRGPILLTARTTLPTPTRDALTRLKPRRGVVLGGTGAVSDAVRDEVRTYLRP